MVSQRSQQHIELLRLLRVKDSRVYSEFAKRIREEKMFVSEEEITWRCRKCGYLMKGLEPPVVCPAGATPK